jgi:thioredoxin-like negative regulator of GroEL
MFRQSFSCLIRRAKEAILSQRFVEAEELIRRVLIRAPLHREARLLRGEMWLRRGWVEQATQEFRQLVDTGEWDVDARLHLAGVLLATGQYTEGIDQVHTLARQAMAATDEEEVSPTPMPPQSNRSDSLFGIARATRMAVRPEQAS